VSGAGAARRHANVATGGELFQLHRHPLQHIGDDSLLSDQFFQGSSGIFHASIQHFDSKNQIFCIGFVIVGAIFSTEL
jgi:hypothetical protein